MACTAHEQSRAPLMGVASMSDVLGGMEAVVLGRWDGVAMGASGFCAGRHVSVRGCVHVHGCGCCEVHSCTMHWGMVRMLMSYSLRSTTRRRVARLATCAIEDAWMYCTIVVLREKSCEKYTQFVVHSLYTSAPAVNQWTKLLIVRYALPATHKR